MQKMPDQQTPVLPGPSPDTYELFVTGVRPGAGEEGGVLSVFTTSNLTAASAYKSSGVVLTPPQQKLRVGACNPTAGDGCADYIGVEAVFPGPDAGDLVGFYIADQSTFATSQPCSGKNFYGQLGIATSQDNGSSWMRLGPTLRGAPVPTTCPTKDAGPVAFNQPTVIKIGDGYYAYFWLPNAGGLAVARSTVAQDTGLPGQWSLWSSGQWNAIPAVAGVQTIGKADAVVRMSDYVTMPWVSYNTYLRTYLMTMITHDGFYYSRLITSDQQAAPSQNDLDAQKWTKPEEFLAVPGGQNWSQCQTTWENLSFVTPGTPDNHTTGKDGLMVLSVVPGWDCASNGERSFDLASFSFGALTPPPPPDVKGLFPPASPSATVRALPQPRRGQSKP
jgi:hypothetical protein